MEQKPWFKSLTLIGTFITAASVFVPKYAPVISGVATDLTTIAGLVMTTIGRLRATQQVTFTNAQK